jgi:hypothetical protein
MNSQSVNRGSLQVIETGSAKPLDVRSMSSKSAFGGSSPWELIDSAELARRWNIPVSWVRSRTRGRTLDELPCLRLGRYVRFRWGSPELECWLSDHRKSR